MDGQDNLCKLVREAQALNHAHLKGEKISICLVDGNEALSMCFMNCT